MGFPGIPAEGLSGTEETVPDLGEHTEAVLKEAGYDEGEIAELREEGGYLKVVSFAIGWRTW